MNGVRPARAPAVSRVDAATLGSVTVNDFEPVPLPLMVHEVAEMLPLKVMVPSTASADCDAKTMPAASATGANANFISGLLIAEDMPRQDCRGTRSFQGSGLHGLHREIGNAS
ncbi:hypothetical protein D3C72_1760450 [compost metagenome]